MPTLSTEIAFGLSPYLHQFALDRHAIPYWKWAQEGLTQQHAFAEVAQKARFGQITKIHFNLDGISDPVASADAAALGLAHQLAVGLPVHWAAVGLTNAELNAVRSDPQLLQLTTFYRNGNPVPSPF